MLSWIFSASSMEQQSMDRHVSPLYSDSQPTSLNTEPSIGASHQFLVFQIGRFLKIFFPETA
jgi:hypothetical protein